MIKPCRDCKKCVHKHGVAGNYYCNEKKVITSIARISGDTGSHKERDCWEGKK